MKKKPTVQSKILYYLLIGLILKTTNATEII